MKQNDKLNLTMLCDFYELTMGNGYFNCAYRDRITYFDVFFRRVPDEGGFAIAAGLDQIIDYILDLHFDAEDIEYLRSRKLFSEELDEEEQEDLSTMRRLFRRKSHDLSKYYSEEARLFCQNILASEESDEKRKQIQLLCDCGLLPLEYTLITMRGKKHERSIH